MRIRTVAVAAMSLLVFTTASTASVAQAHERTAPPIALAEVQSWLQSSSPETIRRTARICMETESLLAEARLLRREQMVRMAIAGVTDPYSLPSQMTDANMRLMQFNLLAQIDYLGPLCPAAIGYVTGEANE